MEDTVLTVSWLFDQLTRPRGDDLLSGGALNASFSAAFAKEVDDGSRVGAELRAHEELCCCCSKAVVRDKSA